MVSSPTKGVKEFIKAIFNSFEGGKKVICHLANLSE